MDRVRELWARIRQDMRDNPGLWIGIGISALVLVVAYLAYRNNLQNGAVVPANGYGFPDYGGASTDTGGVYGGGYNPVPSGGSGSNPFQPFPPTPVTPPVAFPPLPIFSGGNPVPVAPEHAIGSVQDLGAASAGTSSLPSINNPTSHAQQQHTGVAVDSGLLPINSAGQVTADATGRTAKKQQAHTGAPAPKPKKTPPPTTIRPQNSGHGRAA